MATAARVNPTRQMPARMAGDEEDVLLEIDRILAGEDEEPETVEEESDEGGEGEPNDTNNELTEES